MVEENIVIRKQTCILGERVKSADLHAVASVMPGL